MVRLKTFMTKRRDEVHAGGLWHRSVAVWVVDPIKRAVLIQQRTQHKDTNPNCWDVAVAGHIGAGEETLGTALRETAEEIGLAVQPYELRPLFTAVSSQAGHTVGRGQFYDNEYQDVYIFSMELGSDERIATLRLGASEVAALRTIHWDHLEAALRAGDPSFVPYCTSYVEMLGWHSGLSSTHSGLPSNAGHS